MTFAVNPEEHNNASEIFLVGEFNNWDKSASPLKKTKAGKFSTTLDLETGKEYQFRYFIDGKTWDND